MSCRANWETSERKKLTCLLIICLNNTKKFDYCVWLTDFYRDSEIAKVLPAENQNFQILIKGKGKTYPFCLFLNISILVDWQTQTEMERGVIKKNQFGELEIFPYTQEDREQSRKNRIRTQHLHAHYTIFHHRGGGISAKGKQNDHAPTRELLS